MFVLCTNSSTHQECFVIYVQKKKHPYASAASDKKETFLKDGSLARTPFECLPHQQIWLPGTEWYTASAFLSAFPAVPGTLVDMPDHW